MPPEPALRAVVADVEAQAAEPVAEVKAEVEPEQLRSPQFRAPAVKVAEVGVVAAVDVAAVLLPQCR